MGSQRIMILSSNWSKAKQSFSFLWPAFVIGKCSIKMNGFFVLKKKKQKRKIRFFAYYLCIPFFACGKLFRNSNIQFEVPYIAVVSSKSLGFPGKIEDSETTLKVTGFKVDTRNEILSFFQFLFCLQNFRKKILMRSYCL